MSEKNVIISKHTIARLVQDVKNIMKDPVSLQKNGIYYMHDEEDILKGYALIIGPENTPYYGGFYFFEFQYPYDYPHSPPKVSFKTNAENIRFNPNLYTNGRVCISLLNTWQGEQWTSCQTITTILLTLCTILCENPLLNEPGITSQHVDFQRYTNIIEYKNIDISILKIVNKDKDVYLPFFDRFYSIVLTLFLEKSASILDILQSKVNQHPNLERIETTIYHIKVVLHYKKLLDDFKSTLNIVEAKQKVKSESENRVSEMEVEVEKKS